MRARVYIYIPLYVYKNVTTTLFIREKSSLTEESLNQIIIPHNSILCSHLKYGRSGGKYTPELKKKK